MNKIRVKEFWAWGEDETLTAQVNNWLKLNDNIEIINIEYSISTTFDVSASGALVIYKENR